MRERLRDMEQTSKQFNYANRILQNHSANPGVRNTKQSQPTMTRGSRNSAVKIPPHFPGSCDAFDRYHTENESIQNEQRSNLSANSLRHSTGSLPTDSYYSYMDNAYPNHLHPTSSMRAVAGAHDAKVSL